MNIRQELVTYLNYPVQSFSQYELLKSCLIYTNHSQTDGRNTDSMIDEWFKGVIHSLYYRPNHLVLVLKGGQNIGKTEFFRRLLPGYLRMLYYTEKPPVDVFLYSFLICNYLPSTKKEWTNYRAMSSTENFYISLSPGEYPSCEKRLTSFCSTTNEDIIVSSKRTVVLDLESINKEIFNIIDKRTLWIEIFNKFRP